MTAEDVIKRLTPAMQEAVVYPGGYHDPNTIKALRRRGLYSGGALTALGLVVRTKLVTKP